MAWRMPAHATGDRWCRVPLKKLAELINRVVDADRRRVERVEQRRARIQQLDEDIEKLQKEKDKQQTYLKDATQMMEENIVGAEQLRQRAVTVIRGLDHDIANKQNQKGDNVMDIGTRAEIYEKRLDDI